MKRPGFKINGMPGCKIRSKQPDGKVWWRNGRRDVCWNDWMEAVLAGTADSTAEMQILGSDVWHSVEVTPAEARDVLLSRKLGGRTAVKRCEYIRSRRTARGLPVCGTLD